MNQLSWKRRQKELRTMIAPSVTVVEQSSINPYTVVKVSLPIANSHTRYGVGMAKLSPRDVWSRSRGLQIAKGRAIDDLAHKMMGEERAACAMYINLPKFTQLCVEDQIKEIDEELLAI